MKIEDYYLDINLIFSLERKEDRENIFNIYYRMVEYSMQSSSIDGSKSLFNTLFKSGYLKNKIIEEREEKIKSVTN